MSVLERRYLHCATLAWRVYGGVGWNVRMAAECHALGMPWVDGWLALVIPVPDAILAALMLRLRDMAAGRDYSQHNGPRSHLVAA